MCEVEGQSAPIAGVAGIYIYRRERGNPFMTEQFKYAMKNLS